ncbi:hypothetical protein PAXRUDRAFT_148903 [Paxillus rubicundulus Ve08.2h10]|uniref:Uncharacterized protein n=1 Tax=Paxillus rubicundulus Ve08.2h10 TaxID=930991 RepID=A0A0D0D519_9AGAM|nr:hypothetical protein PAXRUDRAFT_148903 [Paxillus rubicundulus Ve08.2h10]
MLSPHLAPPDANKYLSKCPFSHISHSNDDTSPSIPPSSSCPPASTTLNTSYHTPSKCSKTSAANDGRGSKISPAIALVGVQGPIAHLTEMMRTSFLNPMMVIQRVTKALFADTDIPSEHHQFMLGLLMTCGNNAVVYTAIPDIVSGSGIRLK